MSDNITTSHNARWSAVFAVGISVAGLIIAEMLPISLITPMARDLQVSEGTAGQTVTATAIVAIFASLFITSLTRGLDRRHVVMGFSLILVVSGLISALAESFPILIAARLLLGLAVGGLWAMAASLALRLVPAADVPRALSIIFGSASIATVLSAPLSSVLGEVLGWRGVFGIAAGFGVLCFVWQVLTLPPMAAGATRSPLAPFGLFRRPGVSGAMLAMGLMFFGQMALFGYLRPYLEMVSGFSISGVASTLALIGIANFVAVSVVSVMLIKRSLMGVLWISPLIIAIALAVLFVAGNHGIVTLLCMTVWGFGFGLIGIGWSTWITRTLSDDAENAGGLQVAVIQAANAGGAAIGGFIFDSAGPTGPVVFSGAALLFAAILVARTVTLRPSRNASSSA